MQKKLVIVYCRVFGNFMEMKKTSFVIFLGFIVALNGCISDFFVEKTPVTLEEPVSLEPPVSLEGPEVIEEVIEIDKKGLPNFHKVSDDLYRGAEPTNEGIQKLEKMGIKTIVDLRASRSDEYDFNEINIDYINIPTNAYNINLEDVVRFLEIATDPEKKPVFVHCHYGADRTGGVVAAYRVVVEEWSKEDAIKEMTEGGFGFHQEYQNIIKLIEGLNFNRINILQSPI